MHKLKTKKGALKRFKKLKNGKYKRRASRKSHLLTKKNQKQKRRLRPNRALSKSDKASVDKQLNKK